MNETNLTNESVTTIRTLMKSLRDCANYFDEAHEYGRMNELDKVYRIMEKLVPVVLNLSEQRKWRFDRKDKLDANTYETSSYGGLPMRISDELLKAIDDVKDMKPFGGIE